jgi:predicted XRE-type DNA-binding protein
MKDFYPYDIDIDTIPESTRVTDPAEILKYKVSAQVNKIFNTLTMQEIIAKTGLDRSDISRIQIQSIKRFSIDRLIKILFLLDQTVSITVKAKKVA